MGSISLQGDLSLPQGHILVDGQRVVSVSTTGGLSATLATNTVTTNTIANSAVTTEKITNNAVTINKIDPYFTQLFSSTSIWQGRDTDANNFALFTGDGYRIHLVEGNPVANYYASYTFPFDTVLTHACINFDSDSLITTQTCTFVLSVWRHTTIYKDYETANPYPLTESSTVQRYARSSNLFSPGGTSTRASGINVSLIQNNLGIPFAKGDVMTARLKGITSSSLFSDTEYVIYFYGVSKYEINPQNLNFP